MTVKIDTEAIPEELKVRDQWLLWDSSNDTPRQPHWNGNFGISWSDPDDWHSFEEAVEAAEQVDSWGIGYVMAADNPDHPRGVYGVIDIDGCAVSDHGKPKDWVPSLSTFGDSDAYVEWSPSGTGLHIPIVGAENPDWWTDQHFTDDAHEGVELLTHKFCTFTGDTEAQFTGDVKEWGEDVEDWLIEAYKAVTGEDPTKERAEDFDNASEGGRADREEFLEEDDVREALEHVDPDVNYDTWRDIGFALSDFFGSDHTALSVFTDWSRKGSKWDDEAERQAERIIKESTTGGGRTIGTVIHHARNGGWTMPTPSGTGSSGSVPQDHDVDTDSSWDDVREQYMLAKDHSDYDIGAARQAAESLLEDETSWMCVNESDKLWVYDSDSGTYGKYGEQYIGEKLKEELGPHYTKTERSEIIARIKDGNRVFRRELNARQHDEALLCVGNGVVNFDTGELLDHDPEYRFVRGLETEFPTAENGLHADQGQVLDFLDEITQRKADRDTLLDHLAHGLMPGHPYRAFVVAFGPGGNGKTQLAQLFSGFVGEENAASVEIDELVNDDFATGDLPGKFINWGDDMSGDGGGKLQELSTLKKASGGSTIRANEKYEKTFNFKNEAALFFSANEPPRFGEVKPSIKDRLYPIHMPYRFVSEPNDDDPMEKPKVPKVAEQLLEDDAAMRGLLELAVKHGQELRERRGEYSMPEDPDERFEIYNQEADPIARFAGTAVEPADGDMKIRKDDAYRVYQSAMEIWEERSASERGFKRQFPGSVNSDVETARSRPLATPDDEKDRVRCWKRVKWSEDSKGFMPDWMVERYAHHWDDDSGEDETDDETVDTVTSGELEGIDAGFHDVKVTIAEKLDAPDWLEGKGHVVDGEGNIAPYVCEGTDPLKEIEEDSSVSLRNAKVEDRNGVPTLVLSGITEVSIAEQQSMRNDSVTAATDGGDGVEEDDQEDETDSDSEFVDTPDDELEKVEKPDVSGVTVPVDATGPVPNARRIAQYLDERSASMAEPVLKKTMTLDVDLMTPEEFDAALEKGIKEMGILSKGDGGIEPLL